MARPKVGQDVPAEGRRPGRPRLERSIKRDAIQVAAQLWRDEHDKLARLAERANESSSALVTAWVRERLSRMPDPDASSAQDGASSPAKGRSKGRKQAPALVRAMAEIDQAFQDLEQPLRARHDSNVWPSASETDALTVSIIRENPESWTDRPASFRVSRSKPKSIHSLAA